MRVFSHIVLVFFTFLTMSSYGQFWKKSATVTASSGGSSTSVFSDAFSGKNKKGANIVSRGGPKNNSKGASYLHSISKKKFKLKNSSRFNSSKRRYKALSTGSSKQGSNTKRIKSGRKSGKGRRE